MATLLIKRKPDISRTPIAFPQKVVGLSYFHAFMNIRECNVDKKCPTISIDIGPTNNNNNNK